MTPKELVELTGHDRSTIRKALNILESTGMTIREDGRSSLAGPSLESLLDEWTHSMSIPDRREERRKRHEAERATNDATFAAWKRQLGRLDELAGLRAWREQMDSEPHDPGKVKRTGFYSMPVDSGWGIRRNEKTFSSKLPILPGKVTDVDDSAENLLKTG